MKINVTINHPPSVEAIKNFNRILNELIKKDLIEKYDKEENQKETSEDTYNS